MAIEYLGLSNINGPLVVLEGIQDAFFDEIVEARLREILGGGAERFAEECPPCRIQPACDVQQCRPPVSYTHLDVYKRQTLLYIIIHRIFIRLIPELRC